MCWLTSLDKIMAASFDGNLSPNGNVSINSAYTERSISECSNESYPRQRIWHRIHDFFRRRSKKIRELPRTIIPNHLVPEDCPDKEHPNGKYKNNKIKTNKYSITFFIPKNLFEQFHRFANLYFLFIVILNWIPEINAFGKEVSMVPLIFVLAVTAIKDLFEDRRRYKSDQQINHSTCRAYNRKENRYVKTEWRHVTVGDIVHLSCNEIIPADILLLHSSDDQGLCYIETSNLDGENSLKQRQVVRGYANQKETFHPTKFKSSIECDSPNNKIYRFYGHILHPNGEKILINKENLLLRGCTMKNTDFVEGIVVYAGHETKAMLNNGGPRYKRSKLERYMNWDVVWCVIILFILCFTGATGGAIWLSLYNSTEPILFVPSNGTNVAYEGFILFWTYIIVLQVMIPLSLYVTIEIVKLGQVYFIHQDIELFHEITNKRFQCRALNIPEELGQVQYMFSDKTGTLTENNMIFRRCTIGGVDYPHSKEGVNILKIVASARDNWEVTNTPEHENPPYLIADNWYPDANLQREVSVMSLDSLSSADTSMSPQSRRIQEFFLLMAVCNTVVVSAHPHKDDMNASGFFIDGNFITSATGKLGERMDKYTKLVNKADPSPRMSIASSNSVYSQASNKLSAFVLGIKPHYEAESPDELALVEAAYAYGCKLLRRTTETVTVYLPGEGMVEFEILHTLPFDPVRKRMSVVLLHPNTREIILYCKGADSAILNELALHPMHYPDEKEKTAIEHIVEETTKHLNRYAKHGLRTLCLARKILDPEVYNNWRQKHLEAELSLEDHEDNIYESACRLETDLELLGATGIEDRLQEGVPECIASLRKAGIRIWVLTGDKQETAMNIAYSCKLFAFGMEVITLNAKSRDTTKDTINFYLDQIEKDIVTRAPSQSILSYFTSEANNLHLKKRGLVIDGHTLSFALDRRLEKLFLTLAEKCTTVLCCRATPLQKASVVKLVKDHLRALTLAVGDGANDVSMIQTADIGVGISGQEGMQAVMASDFAMARFKYLERLLLVHGHWCYDRLARMVLYFFYKNAAFIFVLFWYQIFNGFTGLVMIDQLYLILYNLIFTSLPPIIMGIYDQDISAEVLLSKPELYRPGRECKVYKRYSFWINMADALYQSLIIFFISYGVYVDGDSGMWVFGTTVTTCCVLIQLGHLGLEIRSWTWMHLLSIVLSILLYFGFSLGYSGIFVISASPSDPYWVTEFTMTTANFWLALVLAFVTALLPRFATRAFLNSVCPSLIVQMHLELRKFATPNIASDYIATWSSSTSTSSIMKINGPNNCRLESELPPKNVDNAISMIV